MRPLVSLLITLLSFSFFTGCATDHRDRDVIKTGKWVGGLGLTGGHVNLEARKIDEHTYEIVAFGAALCTEKQVLEAWTWMADKLAKGRPYRKETKTAFYAYDAPAPMPLGATHHAGRQVSGRMTIE